MQWYECWHSEGVAPQFTKPPLFSLEEMGGYYYTIGMLTYLIIFVRTAQDMTLNLWR